MLVSAIMYKDEICNEMTKRMYDDEMFYYSGWLGSSEPIINTDSNGSDFKYAIIDGGKLIGYFEYSVNWYSSCVNWFKLFSFDRGNRKIGLDVYRELKRLINDYHIHRIEWHMIGGNSVEKHYDNFCNRYNGNKHVLKDVIKDKCGKYHDEVIYEILFDMKDPNIENKINT